MDVIGLAMAGIGEAVASCGTALTAEQVRMMKRFCGQVIVNFDPDTGGIRGAERSIQLLLDEHVRVRVLELDKDMDPDEYVQQHGAEAYLQLLDRAPNYYFWLADQARKRFDSRTAEGRTQALEYLLPAVHRIPDKIERAGVAGDLAAYLGVDRGLVLDEFKKAALDRRDKNAPARRAAPPQMRQAERILLSSLLRFSALRSEVIDRMRAVARWEAASLFRCVFELYEIDPHFGYPDLEARLEDKDRALLSSIVFADETEEEDLVEAARANVDACLVRLESEQEQFGMQALRREIRTAEQRGDLQEALRLTLELDTRRKRQSAPGNH
jgi:DNA primase